MIADEENLIKQAQGGDSGSFGELYHHYSPAIYRFVLLKVNQRQMAEDLTHDVFTNAWQSIGRYTHQGFPFSSWLYQIARNRVIDHYRTHKKQTSIDLLDEDVLKEHGLEEIKLDNSLDVKRVRKAITELSSEQQDVVLMRFMEDMSHQEIAAALDKSEGAVRLLQHRAINKLKNLFSNDNGR
ncbi:MAG: sigma-70 family RNA polymerase sigma factor [bacterium]|nr:sigma-70 family RNA polymerase sigma factor [bacterium]